MRTLRPGVGDRKGVPRVAAGLPPRHPPKHAVSGTDLVGCRPPDFIRTTPVTDPPALQISVGGLQPFDLRRQPKTPDQDRRNQHDLAALEGVRVRDGTALDKVARQSCTAIGEVEHALCLFCVGGGALLGEVARQSCTAISEVEHALGLLCAAAARCWARSRDSPARPSARSSMPWACSARTAARCWARSRDSSARLSARSSPERSSATCAPVSCSTDGSGTDCCAHEASASPAVIAMTAEAMMRWVFCVVFMIAPSRRPVLVARSIGIHRVLVGATSR